MLSPVIWIDIAWPALTAVAAKVNVRTPLAMTTVPPVARATGATVPMAGLPAVPTGTVMVTEDRVDDVAVVNV